MFLHYVEAVNKFGFESKNTANINIRVFFLPREYVSDRFEIPEYRNKP